MSRRLRGAAIAAVCTMSIIAAACSDDASDESTPPAGATAAATAAATNPAATSAATTPGAGATTPPAGDPTASAADEVRGIVGAVNTGTNTIEITRLSGADVTRIGVSPSTEIRRARGGTATLTEIRPSDRIIASGAIEDGVLEADRITVEDVAPGAQPGG